MPSREAPRGGLQPVLMRRVALVAPRACLRDALVAVADAGVVEIERLAAPGDAPAGEAARRLQRAGQPAPVPALLRAVPALDELERTGRFDLLAGEADLEERTAQAVVSGSVAGLAGWAPEEVLPSLAERLAPVGAAVVPLPRPRGAVPPTLLRHGGLSGAFGPLVETYATVPYDDVDPTLFAGLAYVVMFGVMFGDVGHGLLLALLGLVLRTGRPRRFRAARQAAPFVIGAGVASAVVGLGYGDFFGPTGLVPWQLVDPLDDPVLLLLLGIALGAVLLAVAYGIGTVNRVREGGWSYALYAPTGIAGATLFLGAGLGVAGVALDQAWLLTAGVLVALAGLLLSFVGLRAAAEPGVAGVAEALVQLFDVGVRLGSNVVSFARLAAFGLAHAALAGLVWTGARSLWDRGPAAAPLAVAVLLLGNALAFSLEALVAAVQALRLEYYELFSRVFQDEGRPFAPWHVPVLDPVPAEEAEEALS